MCLLLFLILFPFTYSLIIDNNEFNSFYLPYGPLLQESLTGNATFSNPFDFCSVPLEKVNKTDLEGKILVVGYKPQTRYRRYCLLNKLAREMQSLGVLAIIALQNIDDTTFKRFNSIEESSLSDYNRVTITVFDPSVSIPVVQVSQRDSLRIIKLLKELNHTITLTPATSESVYWRRGAYLTLRIYGSTAFSIVAFVAGIQLIKLLMKKYKRRTVGTAPLILLLEVFAIALGRAFQHLIDPGGFLGIIPYYVIAFSGYVSVLLVSMFVLLLLFWVTAVSPKKSVGYRGLLPRVFLYLFIAINIFLVTGQTIVIFSSNGTIYNGAVAFIVLALSVGYVAVCRKFLISLKQARDIKSLVLKKITHFVLAIAIISLVMIPTLIVHSLFPIYELFLALILRILESILLSLVIQLLRDRRVQKHEDLSEAKNSLDSATLSLS